MEQRKLVPVYKLGFMEQLVKQGYHISKVVDNARDSRVKVFMFYWKDGIDEALEQMKNNK